MKIAKKINGEIVSADSRTIYKGMDIGTAKPTMEEMDGVRHYGFDLVEPGERFTVTDWKKFAEQKICSIQTEGKVPIVVGGTGLYIDALVYDYSFSEEAKKNYTDRQEINPRYKIFGIKTDTEVLRERLRKRIDIMFDQNLFDETKKLAEKYGWDNQAMKSDIYEYAYKYMKGEIGLEEAKQLAFFEDWHLAKRQMTWFKRNEHIFWTSLDLIEETVLKYMQDE